MSKSAELQSQIEQLIPKAETGEQWAEICRLESEMVQAMCAEEGVSFDLRYS